MKISDYKSVYEGFSSKLSDLNRQIAFAGIAIIWIFKKTNGETTLINSELILN